MTVRLDQRTVQKKAIKPCPDQFAHIQPKGSWEIPRKAFHLSIGFAVIYLYKSGYEACEIYPALTGFLGILALAEALRFWSRKFNEAYCKVLGPLMRRSEVAHRVNGVVYYLVGCIFALYVFPKDIGAISIVYLSWADPAASIGGRLWGKHTPRFGSKSLAGTLSAMTVGALVTGYFFSRLPTESYDRASSGLSLQALALYGGVVAGVSEALGDSAGLDDNLIIPVVSSTLLWAALVLFEL